MHHSKLNLYIYIHIQISRARSADHRNIKMSAKWIARTPPKRQVEGSNPSGPESILSLYLGPLLVYK